jgi:hypothetical protein
VVFDSWNVNSKTLFPKTVGELRGEARVLGGGRLVPVAEFPEGLIQYLGTPVKLLVEERKGFGRRYFSADLDDGAEDV